MKQRLDNKFWMKFNHCFDCQVELENKMRIAGTYDEWEKNKIKENKIAFIKDQIQAIKEWRETKAPEWLNNVGVNYPELEKEKWNIDMEKFKADADDPAIEAQIQKEFDQMRNSGIPRLSVPKFLVAGKEPQGRDLATFSKMIDEALKK